jgi:hypothetical protein
MEVVTGKPIFETVNPEEEEDAVFAYPYAFFREAIALMITVTGIMAISLFFHAPLEELANPAKTPNPAKAPWYFLGLQELVSHSALLGGVIAPALMVLLLLAIPYFDRNPSRRPSLPTWSSLSSVPSSAARAGHWFHPGFTLFRGLSNGTQTSANLFRSEHAGPGAHYRRGVAGRHALVEDLSAELPAA